YLPFKPKRKTRAQAAREKGLEPLAQRFLEQPDTGDPLAEAAALVSEERGVANVEDALQGARDIVAEVVSETASVRAWARGLYKREGVLVVKKRPGAEG